MCLLSKLSVITLLSYNLNRVNSAGCSSGSIDSYEFVSNAVYGCDGEWTSDGVLNGAYLCGDGYSVCDDISYAEYLGLTYELCVTTDIENNTYYVSGLSSEDGLLDCDTDGNDDLFGCGTPNTPWNYIDDSAISCGPFGVQLSTDSFAGGDGGWVYGWEIWGTQNTANNEFTQTQHNPNGGAVTEFIGGIMCCKDMDTPSTTDDNMEMYGSTLSTMVDSADSMDMGMDTTSEGLTTMVPDSPDDMDTTSGDMDMDTTEDISMPTDDDSGNLYNLSKCLLLSALIIAFALN